MKHNEHTSAALHDTRQEKQQKIVHKIHRAEFDELAAARQALQELEKQARYANLKLRELLDGLSEDDMVLRINEIQPSNKMLKFLSIGIVLEKEDHDISMAIKEVKKSRTRSSEDDEEDHLNYTTI